MKEQPIDLERMREDDAKIERANAGEETGDQLIDLFKHLVD